MIHPIPQISKPERPANRVRGAWYENAYQRESALDLAKRLVRASVPHGSEAWSAQWVARLLKSACGAPHTDLDKLPSRFESRQAFLATALGKGWQVDDDRMADNPAPKRRIALKVLSIIADLPPHHFTTIRLPTPNILHSATSRALLRWTGIDVRGLDDGLFMTPEDARALWEACVKASVWQRAIKAAKQPDAAPITPDLLNTLSVAEMLEAAEAWRFSQPSSFYSTGGIMPKVPSQNPFPLNDGDDEMITTPDNITVRALRESTQALGENQDDTGDFDLPPAVADQIAREIDEEDQVLQRRTQDEPLDPEPDDEETPRQFRERLARILEKAGVRDLRTAFKQATNYDSLDAAIGAGKTRQEIQDQIVAYAETQKNAPQDALTKPSQPSAPKSQIERPAAPKSGQSVALLPMGDTPEGNRFALLVNQAQMFLKSGLLPTSIRTVEQVVTLAAMGEQLGISPIAAINGIDVIQGRPSIKPQLMLALIYKSREIADLQVTDDGETCTVVMTRKGMSPHTETFSTADATAMSLVGKDNWRKQPAVMRKWRTIAAAARVVFPDVIWGFYTPDEMGSTDLINE